MDPELVASFKDTVDSTKNASNAFNWSLGALIGLLKALLLGLTALAKVLGKVNMRPTDPSPIVPPTRPQYAGFPVIVGLGQEENDLAYGLGIVALLLFGTWAVKEAVDEKKTLPTRKRRLQVKV